MYLSLVPLRHELQAAGATGAAGAAGAAQQMPQVPRVPQAPQVPQVPQLQEPRKLSAAAASYRPLPPQRQDLTTHQKLYLTICY